MKFRLIKALVAGAVLSAGAGGAATAAECIAPANPGGGWDFTCRQIGKIMHDIGAVDKPVQVTNMAGAGGGLASGAERLCRDDRGSSAFRGRHWC